MPEMKTKTTNVRIPIVLWRKIQHLKADGKIRSFQAAVEWGLEEVVKNNGRGVEK